MLFRQFFRLIFLITFQLRYLSHKLSCHIHRNGQFRIQRFNRTIYFLRQRLRRFFSRCRIFQEQRQIQRTFTLTVFPA
ncbi:Uncharacterised protein [Shigella sonnei]|nr:Uncharacterised protein [Shigella sonnei]